MDEEWLIDGYNLLHDIASLKNSHHAFPSSKTELFAVLAGFASSKKQKMWMVLDGVGNPEELKVYQTPFFEAVYSQKVSADNHIEKYIYQNKTSTSFLVVTNDRTISELARGGGARVLKNSLFLEMLKEAGRDEKAVVNKEEARSHGFHRPFDDKLKAKGL